MLRLDHGIDVPVKRPADADFGEVAASVPVATVRVARRLDPPQRVERETGWVWEQSGRLYAYRGTDIRDGDIVELPEGRFRVLGGPQNDQVHPMNGHDFGVARWMVERS